MERTQARRLETAPWYFRLAMFLERNRYRGGVRLLRTAEQLGLLNKIVRFPVGAGLSLDVPLYRTDDWWDEHSIAQYEQRYVALLADTAASFAPPVQFIDCGADIGTFALLSVARYSRFSRIVAFEPNRDAFVLLEANLRRLGMDVDPRHAAVSNFRGRGTLESPARDHSDLARYIVACDSGPIDVERIDDLSIPDGTSLIVKVDVEGAELDVVRGAAGSLTRAPRFAVGIEAHRWVVERTGIDPIECVRFLQAIKPCRVVVAEEALVELDSSRPFFEQVGGRSRYNVVCISS